jgi:hypothetical protein
VVLPMLVSFTNMKTEHFYCHFFLFYIAKSFILYTSLIRHHRSSRLLVKNANKGEIVSSLKNLSTDAKVLIAGQVSVAFA